MPSDKKFYLTTPIYYVNARPHIGHAYSTIVADVIARRHRLLGDDTYFLTGTDEHGQKIERSAAAAGIPPQEFADQVSKTFSDLWKRMGITNNDFIRTTSEKHKKGVQKLFRTLQENDAIYLDTYTGQYCVSDEAYVEVGPGEPCPDCGRITETISESNYYFKLSKYQKELIELIEPGLDGANGQVAIQPASRRNEVLSFLRGNIFLASISDEPVGARVNLLEEDALALGKIMKSKGGTTYVPGALKDLSISRTSFKWGIPVPGPSVDGHAHVIYVWLDALANYMTAIGYGSDAPEDIDKFKRYWPADLHLVGKEIIRFHCVYWPAFLLALRPPTPEQTDKDKWAEEDKKAEAEWVENWLPKSIVANGWLLFQDSNNQASKMSKSLGNVVRAETILDAFGLLCPPTPPRPLSSFAAPPLSSFAAPPLSSFTARPLSSFAEGRGSAVPLDALEPLHAAALLKGTASAVPQTGPTTDTALAAEVPSSLAAPQPPTKAQEDLFATDVLRYFLLREIPFGQDGSFSFDAMVQRYNSDLANGYGNLVSRTLSMIAKYTAGSVPVAHEEFFIVEVLLDAQSDNTTDPDRFIDFVLALKSSQGYRPETDPSLFARELRNVWKFIGLTDGHVTKQAPWKIYASEEPGSEAELHRILYEAAEVSRICAAILHSYCPRCADAVWQQLGLGSIAEASSNGELKTIKWGGLLPGTKLGPLSPIFPRADKGLIQTMIDTEERNAQEAAAAQSQIKSRTSLIDEKSPTAAEDHAPTDPAAAPRSSSLAHGNPGTHVAASAALTTERPGTPPHHEAPTSAPFANAAASHGAPQTTSQIAIDDFVKIDLRVAKIIFAERIPKADKLLRLEVDLGYETRQILSGIAEWYAPEELIGRSIVVIANLAPRKMRGLESHGMLLAASHGEDGKPVLATFGEEIALGSRLR